MSNLSLSKDLEQSEEVEKNDENVDSLDTDRVEECLLVVLDKEHVETVSGEHSQQNDEQEHDPDESWETNRPAASLLWKCCVNQR